MVTILIATDKFKGSLPAKQVAAALARGLLEVTPGLTVRSSPVADGGDGTLEAAFAAGYERVPVTVPGPTGEPTPTAFARRGTDAVVELADACGLARLPGGIRRPLTASSAGVGVVLRAVLDSGCRAVLLGIGGSASTDGGAGMLRALGARLLTADGREVPEGGAALAGAARLDLSRMHRDLALTRIRVACDVDNPLTGSSGAAAVYGPQKGASGHDVALLDLALGHWADLVRAGTGSDHRQDAGSGAAGGVGFAAAAVLGAEMVPGIASVLQMTGFADHLAGVDLVVTGEGSMDSQTLRGKAPVGVALAARFAQIPVVAVCGRSELTESQWRAAGFAAVFALSELEPDTGICMRDAARLLRQVGAALAGRIPDLLDVHRS